MVQGLSLINNYMKKFCLILIIVFCGCMCLARLERIAPELHPTYDTVYVLSEIRYLLLDDSTLRKVLVTDTIHSKDSTLEKFPIQSVRILRVDTLYNK